MLVTPYFILILIPIFFSFLFSPFWFIIGESLSFERMKVYALIILVSFGIVEVCVRYMFDRWGIRKRVDQWLWQYGVYLIGMLIFPLVVGWFSFSGLDIPFFWGSYEKRHGYIFFVSILLTFFLFSLVSDKRRYYRASLITASVVAVIAILEYIGFSLFLPELSTQSWGAGRSVSTLGNPNYVAGYLLMHLPFLSLIHRKKYRIFFLFLLIGGIMTTGSLIGSILTLLFLGVYFFRKSYLKMSGIALAFLWMIIFSYWLPHDKMLSFESRFVLMYETLSPLFSNVRHFLFGFGPDAIIEYFQWYRNTILNTYFPSNMNIDSSHNMFIDIAFQYGFIILSGLIFFLVRRYRHLSDFERQAFWLGSIFFSLNVIVLAPLLIFVIILSYGGKLEK